MTNAEKQPVVVDPNFFLPPNVVDMRYIDVDEEDTSLMRDDDGMIVAVEYDTPTDYGSEFGDTGTTSGATSMVAPPNAITVMSEEVRAVEGGGYVVDLIIEVEDPPGALYYDISLTKP